VRQPKKLQHLIHPPGWQADRYSGVDGLQTGSKWWVPRKPTSWTWAVRTRSWCVR